jgi:hypothetical protein
MNLVPNVAQNLPPLQGASLWVAFPGLKPWAESSSPFGANSAGA